MRFLSAPEWSPTSNSSETCHSQRDLSQQQQAADRMFNTRLANAHSLDFLKQEDSKKEIISERRKCPIPLWFPVTEGTSQPFQIQVQGAPGVIPCGGMTRSHVVGADYPDAGWERPATGSPSSESWASDNSSQTLRCGNVRHYLVKLCQAILGLDTGLLHVIVNSVKDCTLSKKWQLQTINSWGHRTADIIIHKIICFTQRLPGRYTRKALESIIKQY